MREHTPRSQALHHLSQPLGVSSHSRQEQNNVISHNKWHPNNHHKTLIHILRILHTILKQLFQACLATISLHLFLSKKLNSFFIIIFLCRGTFQGMTFRTYHCRVNPGLVHRTLESLSTRNWLNRGLFT